MSELVQIRQRIKTIETIQKITHAMRLVAMSAHSRFKKKETAISNYLQAVNGLFGRLVTRNPAWSQRMSASPHHASKLLVIIIGAQKGLCGTFNSNLLAYFTQYMNRHPEDTFDTVIIGKKAIDLFKKHQPSLHIIRDYTNINIYTMFPIAQELADLIMAPQTSYDRVLMFSNELKSFFIQKPIHTSLIPLAPVPQESILNTREDYQYYHTSDELLQAVVHQCLEARILHLIFTSLHAEQAARFFSMDNATRNAVTLLEASKLTYNKLRQAKITKELTELTGSF